MSIPEIKASSNPTNSSNYSPAVRQAIRLPGSRRRGLLLQTAGEQFAVTGKSKTTTAALAKAAGVTEPILYAHFGNKQNLFREAVKANIQARVEHIRERLASLSCDGFDCATEIARATVLACLSKSCHANLTNWALLEDPEYAATLHRGEIGTVAVLWDEEISRRVPEAISRRVRYSHGVMFAIHACLSYGFWLAALGHTPASAGPQVVQFTSDLARGCPAIPRQHLEGFDALDVWRAG